MRLVFLFIFLVFGLNTQAQRSLYPIVENNLHGYIDSTGEIVVPPKFNALQPFSEGLAAARLGGYYGYIDSTGSWVIPPQYEYATAYAEGLAIAMNDKKPFFINRKGQIPFSIDSVYEMTLFKNGIARIKIGNHVSRIYEDGTRTYGYAETGVGLIDKKGQWLLDPIYTSILSFGDGFFKILTEEGNFKESYANKKGKIIKLSKQEKEAHDNFEIVLKNSASQSKEDKKPAITLEVGTNRMVYTDRNNKVVWQDKTPISKIDTLDIDYINRGGFYARSNSQANSRSNGEGGSDNDADSITQQMNFPKQAFTIEIRPTEMARIGYRWLSYKVYVANTTANTVLFDAQDSRLYMNMQALDAQNNWRDIEYLPSSWCGNSYHTIALDPQHFWQFPMPVFKGSMQTRIRLKLKLKNKGNDKDKEIYSNEIKASINPAQFWRKEDYFPNGIMDPYND